MYNFPDDWIVQYFPLPFCLNLKLRQQHFDAGEKNQVFLPEGMQKMEKVLKELHPNQDYRFICLEQYGHIDGIIGKYAVYDLWPDLLSFLDVHSQSSNANDEGLAKKVVQTMDQLELIDNATDLSEILRAAISVDTRADSSRKHLAKISIDSSDFVDGTADLPENLRAAISIDTTEFADGTADSPENLRAAIGLDSTDVDVGTPNLFKQLQGAIGLDSTDPDFTGNSFSVR